MKQNNRSITALFILMITAIAALAVRPAGIDVPSGTPARIDGRMDAAEWSDARPFEMKGGGEVFFKRDNSYLYVGVRGKGDGWAQLYLSEDNGNTVRVLHASAALGTSIYRRDPASLWQPENDFVWELRDRSLDQGTLDKMKAYLDRHSWVANNNNMAGKNEIEFKIKAPVGREVRLAVEYVIREEIQHFPVGLSDASVRSELAHGKTIRDVTFDPLSWAALDLVPASDDKAAVINVVDELFTEMANANPAGILALHTPTSDLAAVVKQRDGRSRYQSITGEAFSKMFTDKTKVMREEMYDPKVEVHGDWAMVWGRYVFFNDDKLSHCGINQFNLVRIEGVWKIANGASTIDPGDCTEKEKAMKPNPAKWKPKASK